MLDIADLLFPTHLSVSPSNIRRVLIIGSCMAEDYVKKFRLTRPEVEFDFILFNNVSDLPDEPPRGIHEYDLQIVQLPVRHVVGDSVVKFSNFIDEEKNSEISLRSHSALDLMLESALKYNSTSGVLTFVSNFIIPTISTFSGLDHARSKFDLRRLISSLNDDLYDNIGTRKNVYLIDVENIASSMGKRYFLDDAIVFATHGGFWFPDWPQDEQSRIETVPSMETISESHLEQFFRAVWCSIEHNYRIVNQIDLVKLVVFDLDDTLWRGVLGEQYGEGSSHPMWVGWPLGLHEAILHLKARGILVAICSKNNASLVEERWSRAVPLEWIGLSDFMAAEINWENKAGNVARIISSANLTPRSVVFVDDNPVERESVAKALPGIRVMGANPFLSRSILMNSSETQTRTVTKETLMREEMIKKQKGRQLAQETLSRAEFLRQLNCRVTIFAVQGQADANFSRVFELLNKTNQFNTTGRRWSLGEVQSHFDGGGKIFAFNVEDKFTPYGLVGVLLTRGPVILQFVMSCRVIGLDIEIGVLRHIVNFLTRSYESNIEGYIVYTDANIVSRDIFTKLGFVETNPGVFHHLLGQIDSEPMHLTINSTINVNS